MKPYVNQETISRKCSEWLTKIAPYNTHKFTLNPNNAALLVIDMQEFFLDPASPSFTCGGPAILANLKTLIRAFRQAGRPVIYTKHVHHPEKLDAGIMGWWWDGMCLENSPESEIQKDIAPVHGEKIIHKH
ncbi:MAG: cysteine hydrolase, partial [Candidatus Marinimicrobia bacterium]|nr:cysteine hydrolase [Candidatus Neomarinimicrobiota bacterium]